MQRDGFDLKDIEAKPNIAIPALFKGAFLANHKWLKDDVKDKIYEHITNRADLILKLQEMYVVPINEMFEEPEEEDEKKVAWDSNF